MSYLCLIIAKPGDVLLLFKYVMMYSVIIELAFNKFYVCIFCSFCSPNILLTDVNDSHCMLITKYLCNLHVLIILLASFFQNKSLLGDHLYSILIFSSN